VGKKAKKQEFTSQQFLMDFIHLFDNTVYDSHAGAKEQPWIPVQYDHFIQLTGQPGADINRVMMSPFSSKLEFNNFSAAHLSLLVPQIKIFRVFASGNEKKEIQLPISSCSTVESIIQSNEGRGTDVAFQNISWQDEALHPDNLGTVRGQMKLHFQSLEGIFMKRGEWKGTEWGFFSLLHTEQARNTYVDKMKMLIMDANPQWPLKIVVGYSVPDDPNNLIFTQEQIDIVHSLKHILMVQSKYYNIDLQENGEVSLTIDFLGNLDTKGASGIKYDLFLASDGSLKDQIVMSETDRLIREEKELGMKIKSNELMSEDDHLQLERSQYGIQQKLLGLRSLAAKDAYAQILSIIDNLKFGGEQGAYLQADDNTSGGRLFWMDLSPTIIQKYIKLKEDFMTEIDQQPKKGKKRGKPLTTEQLKEAKKKKAQDLRDLYHEIDHLSRESTTGKHKSSHDVQSPTKKGEKPSAEYKNHPVHDAQQSLQNVQETKKGRAQFSKDWGKKYSSNRVNKSGNEGSHRLNFFFLGDLIEAACKIIHDRPEMEQGCPPSFSGKQSKYQKQMWKEVRVILGTIRLKRGALFASGGTMANTNGGAIENKCLADIPVSFDAFQTFWNTQVWSKGLTDYQLPTFLLDVCTTLIPAAAQSCVFGGRVPGLKENATLYQYKLPAKGILDEIWKKGHGKRITLDEITKYRWEKPEGGSSSEYREYMHLQGAIAAPTFLTKKGQKWSLLDRIAYNDEHGIPTFYIGNNSGLLKKVSFSRSKTPTSLKMENIARNADASGANLLMADLYTCNVEMFGNPILMNGMYVYINPRSLGLPDTLPETLAGKMNPMEWASGIGLGGYYLIGQVKHRIDNRGYFTSFKAVPDNVQVGFETAKPQKPSPDNARSSIS